MSAEEAAIIDAVAAQVGPAVGAKIAKWTDRLIAKTSEKLIPLLPPETQGLAVAGLASIKAGEGVLADGTEHAFLLAVHHLALGSEDAARLAWLGEGADFDARQHARDQASQGVRDDRAAQDAKWASVRTVALDFIASAGKVAFPILLGFVGI